MAGRLSGSGDSLLPEGANSNEGTNLEDITATPAG
jgi:hypothetical protein